MSFINLANQSFSKNSRPQKTVGLSTQEIDTRINECREKMSVIRTRVDEIQENWKALKEDYQCMSFAKVFDTTVKESMQKAIDDLRIEYNDAKSTLDFYKQLKNKTLLEAEVTIPKDMLFDPDSKGFSLKDIAKKADDEEKERKEAEELERLRAEYRERASEIVEEVEDALEKGMEPSDVLEILFNHLVPSYGSS